MNKEAQNNNNNRVIQLFNEHLKDPKYKTEICKNWERNGSCPYNMKCRFAHGKLELIMKETDVNPFYKYKDCLNFFKFGYCNYGRRCCFKHDEKKLNEQNMYNEIKIVLNEIKSEKNKRLEIFQQVVFDPKVDNLGTSSKQMKRTTSLLKSLSSGSQSTNSKSTTAPKSLDTSREHEEVEALIDLN